MYKSIALLLTSFVLSCKSEINSSKAIIISPIFVPVTKQKIDTTYKRILSNIPAPNGYEIQGNEKGSYAHYLQNLPLKPEGSPIKYYDGQIKSHFKEYIAVLDLPIGNKDLHQCADAIIRLRADYLWNNDQFDKIHFNFTNGMKVNYRNWMQGQRIQVKGNKTSWYQAKKASNTTQDYWDYIEQIWMYAGTLSLSKELKKRKIADISIGDVFIQGGSPGHAIIILNIAQHKNSREKLILLAQSYMPAQETHILTNPNDPTLSPWYSIKDIDQLITPEWTFNSKDLMYFEN